MPVRMEDDYVLTISDNDEFSHDESESEVEVDEPVITVVTDSSSATAGVEKQAQNKRKRGGENNAGEEEVVKSKKQKQKGKTQKQKGAKAQGKGDDDAEFASDFEFEDGLEDGLAEDDFDSWGFAAGNKSIGRSTEVGVDVDEIIARRRKALDPDADAEGSDGDDADSEEAEDDDDDDDDEFTGFDDDEDDEYLAKDGFGMGASARVDEDEQEDGDHTDGEDGAESDGEVAHGDEMPDSDIDSDDDEKAQDSEEEARQAAFFAPEPTVAEAGGKPKQGKPGQPAKSFMAMNLSRPIMRGLDLLHFYDATPIQQKAIPIALMGKDIVGGAETGSGKTAAFLVPILERLMYRSRQVPLTRVAILMPTRELAVQCHAVATQLASFTDITFALLVGGFSLREQEAALKRRPDVVIATPGRFIDHMRNSAGFEVDMLEILVLDEADRMLEDGFADELDEILKTIPKSRQTMLFSATMTNSVDKLIRAGLNRPVRLMVNQTKSPVSGLVQEFVRLRPGKENMRLPYLLYLCEKIYRQRAIIFFRQKQEVHRVKVLFGLCGLKAAELHGSMSQEQRLRAVEDFRNGNASFLLATDVASRGLDIKSVDAVINYEAPQTYEIYIHRVGRTARAGRTGRSCTLVVESDRKIVKAAKKGADAGGSKAVSRNIPPDEGTRWVSRIAKLEPEIEAVLKEEKAEKAISQAERELKKGENLIEHRDEILARPKRTWFESEGQKKAAKEAGLRELNGGDGHSHDRDGGTKKVKVSGISDRLSNKQKKQLDAARERKGESAGVPALSKGKSRAVREAGAARGAGVQSKAKLKAKGDRMKDKMKNKAKAGAGGGDGSGKGGKAKAKARK